MSEIEQILAHFEAATARTASLRQTVDSAQKSLQSSVRHCERLREQYHEAVTAHSSSPTVLVVPLTSSSTLSPAMECWVFDRVLDIAVHQAEQVAEWHRRVEGLSRRLHHLAPRAIAAVRAVLHRRETEATVAAHITKQTYQSMATFRRVAEPLAAVAAEGKEHVQKYRAATQEIYTAYERRVAKAAQVLYEARRQQGRGGVNSMISTSPTSAVTLAATDASVVVSVLQGRLKKLQEES